MRRTAAVLGVIALSLHAAETTPARLVGYTAEDSAAEVKWENTFRAIPDQARLRENMRRLTARPHHVGSPYDKDNAEWMVTQLKSFGLDAKIETMEALFPTPKHRELELIRPDGTKFIAKLKEPALKVDPTSDQEKEQLPTYNAYSKDGDVTGELVYVNYGAPADYDELDKMGISVKGKIVLARYGQTWRGIKPKVAAQHGAIGCLIFSDPKDDGYYRGGTYPEGPMRPPDGAQRGSVMDMPVYPGDPQSPGVGATPGQTGLIPLDKVETITKIPVMPISYADATPLLQSLDGEIVPEAWRGGLPFPYKFGPSKAKAHLSLQFNWDRKPLYDVIMTIPGAKLPDEWVIRGNHHDAWVNGAGDPISGASPELEEARALGELLKQGWKPARTIIYAWWDGEEPALLGSTEWAEKHADELKQHAVAYFNSDGNSRGFFRAEGTHSLEAFMNGVLRDIKDPETGMSVWKRASLAEGSRGGGGRNAAAPAAPTPRSASLKLGALGSGSDYTVFIDHLGIASMNIGYGGEDQGGGQYHSIYDDFYWYTHFEDTDFSYGKALAQTGGTMVLRMADADVLPYQYGELASTVTGYVHDIEHLASTMRSDQKAENEKIESGVYKALADPKLPMIVPPTVKPLPPYLNFAALDQAADDLTTAAAAYDKALAAAKLSGPDGSLDMTLMGADRAQLDTKGLPNRPWFQNMYYAPGFYTGYGVKTLPAAREAIEQKEWDTATDGIARTAAAIEKEADALKKATAMLPQGGGSGASTMGGGN